MNCCEKSASPIIIERLRLTSPAVKHPQTLSVIFRFAHKTARQELVSSTVILETQAAWHLPSIYYCINFRCSAVTMLIKLSSYVTWSTSETVASVQLLLNAVFFCLAEVQARSQGGFEEVRTNPPCSLAKCIFKETAAVLVQSFNRAVVLLQTAYKPLCSCYKR